MKTELSGVALLLCLTAFLSHSQAADSPRLIDAGPHHQTWELTRTIQQDGEPRVVTSSYVQLESGLNVWSDAEEKWVEASDEIELVNRGAVARKAQHKVIYAADVLDRDGTIDLQLPGNKRLRVQPIGIAFTDVGTGRSVFIAEVQPTTGELVADNVVEYPAAFDAVDADIRYTMTRSSFEQDIIFRQRLPSPVEFGLNPANTKLEVWTHVLESPAPGKRKQKLKRRDGREEADERLDFDTAEISRGRAFSAGLTANDGISTGGEMERALFVAKEWIKVQGAVFLIESVPYEEAKARLDLLPASGGQAAYDVSRARDLVAASGSTEPLASASSDWERQKPVSLASLRTGGRKRVAAASESATGAPAIRRRESRETIGPMFVMDFAVTLYSGSNFTFQADTTYYVSGTVNLTGKTTFEGGAVVKFNNTSTTALRINGPLDCQTDSFRPVIFTAKDDGTIGDAVAGAAASPSGYYGYPVLGLDSYNYGPVALSNFRISWARTAIDLYSPYGLAEDTFTHGQFANCERGINLYGGRFAVRNALFWKVQSVFTGVDGIASCQHLTVDSASYFNTYNACSSLSVVNSIFCGVTSLGAFTGTPTVTVAGPSGVFQTVGAGGHYLVDYTVHRDAGTTIGLSEKFLRELGTRTTFPPMELSYGGITADTLLQPRAQRDTQYPDLGYHYDPIDYVVSGFPVSGCTLTLNGGVVIGVYGSTGLKLQAGARIVSEGTPLALNRLVRYHAVQEQFNTAWTGGLPGTLFREDLASGIPPEARFRFTEFPMLASGGSHFSGGIHLAALSFTDCQFNGGDLSFNQTGYSTRNVALTNSAFERVRISLGTGYDTTLNVSAWNNLFRSCPAINLNAASDYTWTWRDNFFVASPVWTYYRRVSASYNAYLSCNPISGDTMPRSVSEFTFESGDLGRHYQASTAQTGSRLARDAGLYHHTTRKDQTKEAATQVDIGFHYVALINGKPTDMDGDAAADYLEDRNGNGSLDATAGESNWQNANPVFTVSGTAIGYTENQPPILAASTATVTDIDSPDFIGGKLQVSVTGAAGDEVAIRHQGTAAGQIGISGANVTFGGVVIGTLSGGAFPTPLIVNFTATAATPAAAQALLRSVTYRALTENPAVMPRTIQFRLEDGDGGIAEAARALTVVPLPDPPRLTSIQILRGAVRNTPFKIPYALLAAAADESDPDSATVSFRVESVLDGKLEKGGMEVTPGQTLLSSNETLVWAPPSDQWSASLGAFTVTAFDGALGSTTPITVGIEVRYPPELRLLPGAVRVHPKNDAVQLAPNGSFVDEDYVHVGPAKLVITGDKTDQLTILNRGLITAVTSAVDETTRVLFQGAAIATAKGGDWGKPLVLEFNGAELPGHISALVQAIGYRSAERDRKNRFHRITASFSDGAGQRAYDKIDVLFGGDPPVVFAGYDFGQSARPSGFATVQLSGTITTPSSAEVSTYIVDWMVVMERPEIRATDTIIYSQTLKLSPGVQQSLVCPAQALGELPPGRFRYRLRVSDGRTTVNDEVEFIIYEASAPNAPPIVNIDPVAAIEPGTTVTFRGGVIDDGKATLTFTWSAEPTPAAVPIGTPVNEGNRHEASFRFDVVGTYRVQLEVTDGGMTGRNETFVTVCDKPRVPADVVVVLDQSGSMGDLYIEILSGIRSMIEANDPSLVQFGFVAFTDISATLAPLGSDREVLEAATEYVRIGGGKTYTDAGLRAALEEFTPEKHRAGALPVVLLVSDGLASRSELALQAAFEIKAKGIRVVTVYISETGTPSEFMVRLASSPDDAFAVPASRLQEVINEVIAGLCSDAPNRPPSVIVGPMQEVLVGNTAILKAEATDDGNPKQANGSPSKLTYRWTAKRTFPDGLPLPQIESPESPETIATFSAAGFFEFEMVVADDGGLTDRASTWVRAIEPPPTDAKIDFAKQEHHFIYQARRQRCEIPDYDGSGKMCVPLCHGLRDPTALYSRVEYWNERQPYWLPYWDDRHCGICSANYCFLAPQPGGPAFRLPQALLELGCEESRLCNPLFGTAPDKLLAKLLWGVRPMCWFLDSEPTLLASYALYEKDEGGVSVTTIINPPGDVPTPGQRIWFLEVWAWAPGAASDDGTLPIPELPDNCQAALFLGGTILDIKFHTKGWVNWGPAWSVDAGSDQVVPPGSTQVSLNGKVEGHHWPSVPSVTFWSSVPGVRFPDGTGNLNTRATLPSGANGIFKISLTVAGKPQCGPSAVSDDVWISVGTASVDVGPDQLFVWQGSPLNVELSATVTGATIDQFEWKADSDAIEFSPENVPNTSATIYLPGTHTIVCETPIGRDSLILFVNEPPRIAMPDLSLFTVPLAGLQLQPVVVDDGLPLGGSLSFAWEQVYGPEPGGRAVFTSPFLKDPRVSFSRPGQYKLKLTVRDGNIVGSASSEETLTIDVAAPKVRDRLSFTVVRNSIQNTLSVFSSNVADEGIDAVVTSIELPAAANETDFRLRVWPHADGQRLLYTPPRTCLSTDPCCKERETFVVHARDSFDNPMDVIIDVVAAAGIPSAAAYELTHTHLLPNAFQFETMTVDLSPWFSACDVIPPVLSHGPIPFGGTFADGFLTFTPDASVTSVSIWFELEGRLGLDTVIIPIFPITGNHVAMETPAAITVEQGSTRVFTPQVSASGFTSLQYKWSVAPASDNGITFNTLEGSLAQSANGVFTVQPQVVRFDKIGTFELTLKILNGATLAASREIRVDVVPKGSIDEDIDVFEGSEPLPQDPARPRAAIYGFSTDSPRVLHTGEHRLFGEALPPDNNDPNGTGTIRYLVRLYRDADQLPDEDTIIIDQAAARVEPQGELCTLILASLPNGTYWVELEVVWGTLSTKTPRYPFILESDLKLGNLTFTVTDFTVPAGEQSLPITRTYDSQDMANWRWNATAKQWELITPIPSGHFGPGWLYGGYELDVLLDEQRQPSNTGSEGTVRTGGSGNLELTLPGSNQRVYFVRSGDYPNSSWAPSSQASIQLGILDSTDTDKAESFAGAGLLKESFDYRGFLLTLPGAVECELSRGAPVESDLDFYFDFLAPNFEPVAFPGLPFLTRIKFPGGGTVRFATESTTQVLTYFPPGADPDKGNEEPTGAPTRTVTIQKDATGRVLAIYDPLQNANRPDVPTVQYTYFQANELDASNVKRIGCLKSVKRLAGIDTAGQPVYETTTLQYRDLGAGQSPVLEKVVDNRGVAVIEASWNSDGTLQSTVDASGVTRSIRSEPGKQIVTVPLGNLTAEEFAALPTADLPANQVETEHQFDSYGRITKTITRVPKTPRVGEQQGVIETARIYEPAPGNPQWDPQTPMVTSVTELDALNRASTTTYDAQGQVTAVFRAGGVTQYRYNEEFQLTSVTDPSGRTTSTVYDSEGRVEFTTDALQNATRNHYDNDPDSDTYEKLLWTEDALRNRTLYEYYTADTADSEGDGERNGAPGELRKTTVLQWRPGDTEETGPTLNLTETVQTYYPDGNLHTTEISRDAAGDPANATVKTEYKYDAQNRLIERIEYPSDNPYTKPEDESQRTHVTKTQYDAVGRVSKVTDKYGAVTESTYDKRGNLVQTIFPGGVDGTGNSTPVTVSRTVYDVNNRPIYQQQTTLPPSGSLATDAYTGISYAPGSRTTYDGLGRVLKSEALTEFGIELVREDQGNTAAGYKTRVRKNTQGALVGRDLTSPSLVLSSTSTQYDAVGRTLRTTDSPGNYRRYEYFDEPAITKVYAGGPGATEVLLSTTTYDLAGNQQSVVTNGDRLTEYKYDALNRQTEVWFPAVDGVIAKTVTEYDALGRRKAFTDEENKTTRFEYDGLGRLTKVIDADSKTTEFGYDELGNLIWQDDALKRRTWFEYDNFGRRIKRQLPGGQIETFSYDPWDATRASFLNRKTHADFNSKTTTHDHDVRGRLVKKTPHSSFGSSSTVFRYTPAGQRRTIMDPSGTTTLIYGRLKPDGTFAYDSDRLLVKNHTDAGAITYDFDSRGNVARIDATKSYTLSYDTTTATYRASVAATDANRTLLTYSYDFQGRLSEVRTGSSGTVVAKYDYHNDGTLQKLRYAQAGVGVAINGIRQDALAHTFNYDARHRLTDMTVARPGVTPLATFNYNPADRPLGLAGERMALRETLGSVSRSINYSYDKLYRLTKEEILPGPAVSGSIDYGTYDAVGNRQKRTVTGSALAAKVPSASTYKYDLNDRLDPDSIPTNANANYDANGNTLYGDLTSDAILDQPAGIPDRYDFENRLIQAARGSTTISAVYDADGHRIRKTVGTTTTRYLVDDRNPTGYAQVIEEWTSVSGQPFALACSYVYGLDLISQRRGTTTSYYVYDGLGSVRGLANSSGSLTDTYTYDAFGILIAQTATSGVATPNHYRFTGEQWDADLGMYYLRARYLNPQSGRFWTMDSFEGSQSDPLSLHKYSYTEQDPINHVDPSGHMTMIEAKVTVGLWGGMAAAYVSRVGPRVQIAFGRGAKYAGQLFTEIGAFAQHQAGQVLRLIETTVHNLHVEENVRMGTRVIDFVVRYGNRVAQIEVKYGLPYRTGPALMRLVGQVEAAALPGKGQIVLWTLRAPSPQQITLVTNKLGANASRVQFVHGVEGVFQWARLYFGF